VIWGCSIPSFAQDEDIPVIRAEVEVVNILATVRNKKGQYVDNLTKNDFVVYEDGVKQNVEFFNFEAGADAQPLTIVLLIDTSGSVKDKLRFEQRAASEFLNETLRKDKDMAAVVQFDSEINLIQDFTYDFDVLAESILDMRAGGATKLYDAIFLAVEDLLVNEVGRKVLVVLSDGADTQSLVSDREAIKAAQSHDVVIFGIGVRSRDFGADFGKLNKFAESTGGVFFKSKADLGRLREAFARINQEIKNQYSIGYVSSNLKKENTFRKIAVKVKKSGLKVIHRKGYYASEPSS
jgi:Ca-activated chloride channel family protein